MTQMNEAINNEGNFKLPEQLDTVKTRKKKFSKFKPFSFAVFRESFKSNFLGTLGIGLLNAIILVIVVGIMSSLNINGTKTAMMNMFDSAGNESTLKMGAVGLYANYSNSAETYLTLNTAIEEAENSISSTTEKVTNSATKTQVTVLEGVYDVAYAVTSGTSDEKHSAGQSAVQIAMSLYSYNSDSEKEQMTSLMSSYFDQYYLYKQDNTNALVNSYEKRMTQCLPAVAVSTLEKQLTIDESTKEQLQEIFLDAFNQILVVQDDVNRVASETAIKLIPLVSDSSQKEMATEIADDLYSSYTSDKDKYANNTEHYRDYALSESIQNIVIETFEDVAYYNSLPSFDVIYLTSDLGWPLSYQTTGEIDTDGNPVKQLIEVKYYDPDNFIVVQGGMGTPATMIQKMRKEALTGTPYTQEEIDQAKIDSQANIDTIKTSLTAFMNDFIVNQDTYLKNGEINDEAIQNAALDNTVESAKTMLLDQYNESYGTSISSIDQMDAEKLGMTGEQLLETCYSYASAGIASYKAIYALQIENGVDTEEAVIVALVKSSTGVIDQLPSDVSDSLVDLSNDNTYGFFVGVVTFGIACVLLPLVYTIILANNLVAEKVETGSLAFTLSTPTKRSTFINTEALYLVFTEIFLSLLLFLGALIAREIGIAIGGEDLVESLTIHDISLYSFGQFMVMFAISGICFFSSSFFNKTRHAIALGGGLNISFYIFSIMGLFGTEAMPSLVRIPAMNFFNYLTILSLNDGLAVMEGNVVYWYKLIGLLAIGLVTYVAGKTVFKRKDLPL